MSRSAAWLLLVLASAGTANAQYGGPAPAPPQPLPPSSKELSAASAASPRPSECAPAPRQGRSRVATWDRARRPRERAYCDSLARGYSALGRLPSESLVAADLADRVLPGRAATAALRGRALLALGKHKEAFAALEQADKRDRRALEAPAAMHDFAVAALLTGDRARALSAYRQLVPRASLLPELGRRQRVLVEAALIVMSEGPSGLDEAVGYLGEARRQRGAPGLSAVVLGALALALDRQGRAGEAKGVVTEAGSPLGPAALAASPEATRTLAAPAGELHALAAVLVEKTHPEVARQEWQEAIDQAASGPWVAHAKQKLSALGTRVKKPGPR